MQAFFLFLVFFTSVLWAQEEAALSEESLSSKKIYSDLDELQKLSPTDYLAQIISYRRKIERFIEYKRGVCSGNFSTVILNSKVDQAVGSGSSAGLTMEEKVMCLRELESLQLKFINSLYFARKNYLEHLHKRQLEELSSLRETSLKDLRSNFSEVLKQVRSKNK